MEFKLQFALLVAIIASLQIFCEVTGEDSTTPQYVNYGEPCADFSDCDSNAHLSCINGSCQCALGDKMKFDDASSSCWVLPGEKCIYRTNEIAPGVMLADINAAEERTALMRGDKLSFQCVSNSACDSGYCTCSAGYYQTTNGTCEPQRGYQEPCEFDESCRSSLHLVCNQETRICECPQNTSVWDNDIQMCTGLSGVASCFEFEVCTKNAYCSSQFSISQYDIQCECKPGFYEVNHLCVPKSEFGENCTSDDQCREDLNLVCSEGKCSCNTNSTKLEEKSGKCLGLVGTSCNTDASGCVQNAQCQHVGFINGNVLEKNMVCKCAYGYFENGEKLCEMKREHDQKCDEDIQCRQDLKLICNRETKLCACNETVHFFDRSKKTCISRAGTFCESNDQCVINSICRSPGYLYPRINPKAECMCKDGYAKSEDGFCLGKYGSRCESWTRSCQDGLVCRNGECSCKLATHQQYYDYLTEECKTYINAPCTVGSNETSCVANSYCGMAIDGQYRCLCNAGLITLDGGKSCSALVESPCSEGDFHGAMIPCVPHAKCERGFCACSLSYYASNGTCVRKSKYGEYCESSDSCEDSFCDINGHFCSCNNATSIFDPTRKKCMRKAAAKCFDVRDCVPNALCSSPGRLNPDENAVCTCKDNFYANTTSGYCEWKRSYGEVCEDNSQCQDSSDLVCGAEGTCTCNSTTSVYEKARRKCVKLAGTPCSSNDQCTAHSFCKNPPYWIHYDTFSPNAVCTCDQDKGYTNSSDGRCVVNYYGGRCDIAAGVYCSSKFVCEEGKCLCPYEDHQEYDFNLGVCISLVNGPCSNDNSSMEQTCVKNAYCAVTEEGVSECRCMHGFVAVDRKCELTFGQPCSSTPVRYGHDRMHINRNNENGTMRGSKSEDMEEPRCDRLAPLKCIHGTCQCGNFQFYDYELQRCRGLLGARCDPDDKKFCTEGASCHPYRSLSSSPSNHETAAKKKRYGRCTCMNGYVVENRACSRLILQS